MKTQQHSTLLLIVALIIAFGLWYVIFGIEAGNFWLKISLCTCSLAVYAIMASLAMYRFSRIEIQEKQTPPSHPTQIRLRKFFGPHKGTLLRHILIGIGSAVILYGIFWFGDWFLSSLFSVAESKISSVYASRGRLPAHTIALLLAFVTSPAEEIFWRGFIQRQIARRSSPLIGLLLATTFYSLVHIWTLNLPLLLAAAVAGTVWGLIFLNEKSLIPVIISHALWSVTVFIILPFA